MEEQIILVNEKDEQIGTMGKLEAHQKGMLHRAFSIFVKGKPFSSSSLGRRANEDTCSTSSLAEVKNKEGKFLIQKRAATKYHSGGLWTNTCCGHPRAGEEILAAAHRRLREEMGFDCELKEVFVFHYTTPLERGLTENEIDHVFIGTFDEEPNINPEEAEDWTWMTRQEIEKGIAEQPQKYTYWFGIAMQKAKDGNHF